MRVSASSFSGVADVHALKRADQAEVVKHNPQQPTKPVEGVSARSATVEAAVDKIRNKMHSSIFNPAAKQALRDVQNTIADLSKEDASAAVGKFSDSELRDISNQIMRHMSSRIDYFDAFAMGHDGKEKKAFFDTMAQKLDGEQLARMTNAFEQSSLGSTEGVNALGRSIAEHASNDIKLEYIKALKGSDVLADQPSVISMHQGDSILKMSDPQAQAAAQVIASMGDDPAKAGQALDLLRSKELEAVIKASADPTINASDISLSSGYDAAAFQKLMQTAAKTKDADLKSRIFNLAAQELKKTDSDIIFKSSADTAAMRQGMHSILMSDVEGVMNQLAKNRETSIGTAMAIYSKSALNAEEYEQLGNIHVRLMLGNDLSGDHLDRFNSPEKGYMHAQNLGYFAGAMASAVTAISNDANKQAEIVNAVIGSAATVIGGVGVSVGAAASGFAVKGIYDQTVNDRSDAVTKLLHASLPFASAGVRPNGEHDLEKADRPEAFSPFEDTWNWIKNNAKP